MILRTALPLLCTLAIAAPASAESKSGPDKLAAMLEGRSAGQPRDCITARPVNRMTIIDGTTIVYDAGSTLYVNYTSHPEDLDDNDLLKVERYGMQLCRTDQVTAYDRSSGFFSGPVFLTEFIPYTRSEKRS